MIKKITICGVLSSLAIVVSVLERLVPIQVWIPIPGIKLGIANCIILFALCKMGFRYAFPIMLCKCLVVGFLFTGFTSLIYSLSGGILSLIGMFILLRFSKNFSIYGISVAGAALHSVGQIVSAYFMMNSVHIFSYLSVLLLVSIVTGLLVGLLANILNNRIKV